jgi:hypothetical protein
VRNRLPEIDGKRPFQILLRQVSAERLARRQAGIAADAAGQRVGQIFHRRAEIAALVFAAHQAFGLFFRRAAIGQRIQIEVADTHILQIDCRQRVSRLAGFAPRSMCGVEQQYAREHCRAIAGMRVMGNA